MRLPRRSGQVRMAGGAADSRAFQLGAGCGGAGDKGQSGRKGWARSMWELSKNGEGGPFVFLMPKTKDAPNRSFWRNCLFLPLFSSDLGLGSRAGLGPS